MNSPYINTKAKCLSGDYIDVRGDHPGHLGEWARAKKRVLFNKSRRRVGRGDKKSTLCRRHSLTSKWPRPLLRQSYRCAGHAGLSGDSHILIKQETDFPRIFISTDHTSICCSAKRLGECVCTRVRVCFDSHINLVSSAH